METTKTLLLETNKINKNNRYYPKEVVKKSLLDELIQTQLNNGSWFGEAGQPIVSSLNRIKEISLLNTSHIIKNVYFKEDNLYGQIIFTDTKVGQDLKSLYEQGLEPKFALRGIGNVKSINGYYEVTDLKIITFDWDIENSTEE